MTNNARLAQRKERDVSLQRVIDRPDGGRYWPELLFAQPLGFRALTMSLAVPHGGGPHPVVVYIHGGGWMLGHPHAMHPKLAEMDIDGHLLRAGYAVARISYRLSSEGRFPMQIEDCHTALRYLATHAARLGIDPDRCAAFGESAGAQLALLLGLETPVEFRGKAAPDAPECTIRAVVDWYGITDILRLDDHALPNARFAHDTADSASARLIGGRPSEHPEAARAASPLTWVSAAAKPVLIQHGFEDSVIGPGQGEALFNALRAAGVTAQWAPVPQADHCFMGGDTTDILPQVVAFLDRHLTPNSAC